MLGVRSADPEDGVVLAEAVKFDTGDVVLILLGLLASLIGTAFVLGGLGLALGIGVARIGRSKAEVAALPRGNLLGLWVLAGVLSLAMWMAPWFLFSGRMSGRSGVWLGLVGSVALPALWGWWNGRTRRYSGPPSPPTPWPPPPPVDPAP
jgi:hypothetical protein